MDNENIYYCELDELKRTRIYLEMTVPNIVKFSNCLISTIFIFAIIFIFYAKYNVVVKSTGIIRSAGDVVKSVAPVNGIISRKYFSDGDYVFKGDTLYEFENQTVKTEIEIYKQKICKLETEIEDYENILSFIEEGKKSTINSSSIVLIKNMIQKLKMDYQQSQHLYEISKDFYPQTVSLDELKQKEYAMTESKITYENFILEKKLESREKIIAVKLSLNEMKNHLEELQASLNNYIIKTPTDGYVYQCREITEGEFIFAGDEVLKIIPYENNRLKMIVYVSPNDIAELKKNMKLRISFPKYPYSEYSAVNGFISFIPKDSSVLPDGSCFYLVETQLTENKIFNRRTDKEIPIVPGMKTSVKIITRTEPLYLFFYHKLFG